MQTKWLVDLYFKCPISVDFRRTILRLQSLLGKVGEGNSKTTSFVQHLFKFTVIYAFEYIVCNAFCLNYANYLKHKGLSVVFNVGVKGVLFD